MARLLFGVVLFTMVFAQATIVPVINPFVVSPDFVLLLLFAASMYTGVREGLSWLFVAGIVTDVLAMDPLGANGLALLPAVLLVGPARRPIFRANILIPIALMLVATVLHALVLCAVRGVMPDLTIGLQVLQHAIIFPFLYLALRWLE
jgi:rod shape-determining protein MreD